MKVKEILIGGEIVKVRVCKPSRRQAESSIQKPRYQRNKSGAKYVARERGQFDDGEM